MVELSSFKDAGGTAWKWDKPGQTLAGKIEYVSAPEEGTSFSGEPITQIRLTIEDETGDMHRLWPKIGPKLSNLGRNLLEAADYNLEVGAKISIQYLKDEDIGKPSPMRSFTVAYTPPADSGADTENDFF